MRLLFITFIALIICPNMVNAEGASGENTDPRILREQLLKLSDDDYFLGNKNAPVTFIEYSSLGCPHCQTFHKESFEAIKKQYIDTGKVLFIYRHFPTNKAALAGSKLVTCVEKDKFFSMLSALFIAQPTWAYNEKYKENLLNIAKLAGITQESFNQCMENPDIESKILNMSMNGSKAVS